jgi:hypothetical protein
MITEQLTVVALDVAVFEWIKHGLKPASND